MTKASLLVQRDGDVKLLGLSRPEKLNALDAALVEALLAEVEGSASDGTRLLVLKGEGKGFSGGFDFSDLDHHTDGELALRFLRLELLLQAITHAPFVTMALAHGACFGAAADIVASCTRRIGAPEARFRMPGLRFGVVLGTRRLAHLIGRERARALLLTSKTFGADEALGVGFIDTILPQDQWADCIAHAAEEARTLAPAQVKVLLDVTTDDSRDRDLAELARAVAQPGLKQRIQAYLAALKR